MFLLDYIVIDLEFNNLREITEFYPDFYENNSELIDINCPNEIIEIGAIRLDRAMREIGRFKTYVKPNIYKLLNPRVSQITGITEEHLKQGVSFIDALKNLGNFVGDDSIICSWAKDDIAEIMRNADYYNFSSIEWLKGYIDLQEYCTKILVEKKSISLINALNKLRIKVKEEELHDALNDAYYTSEVFRRIFNDRAVKSFVIRDIVHMPSIMIRDLGSFELDEEKAKLSCPKCGSIVELQYPLKLFKWRFIGIGSCLHCKSKILQKIVVKQSLAGDKVYLSENRFLNDKEYIELVDRFEHNKIID
jgi:DNA polymerase III epsilon subunit-like protein/DNA-directed RNA polymerase subunit RPC12/RpoP